MDSSVERKLSIAADLGISEQEVQKRRDDLKAEFMENIKNFPEPGWVSERQITSDPATKPKSDAGNSYEWKTPDRIFAPLHARYDFTIDLAAADNNHLLSLYLTKEQDALSLPWSHHRGWCNPPYSRGEIRKWVAKAFEEAQCGALTCMLLPASTDTAWWHDWIWNPDPVAHELLPLGSFWSESLTGLSPRYPTLVKEFDAVRISVEMVFGRLQFTEMSGKMKGRETGARTPSAIVVYEPGGGYRG